MDKIGKYEIVERIGRGGFGEVFKAWDPHIKRHVAVKTCISDEPDVRRRFFQEAEIAGRLQHRNITTVFDFGIEEEVPFLVQELLSGEDLDRKIKRREEQPYDVRLDLLLQIARGLGHAHENGVIHRDVKPANVRILEDGSAKILDFGIAKLAQEDLRLTRTGTTLGTAAYLAPEQIRGEEVTPRTDVFSFGVLAFELLTHQRPFRGEQISAVLHQILNEEPRPIREVWPQAPPEVVELLDRCLAKDPADRFADGDEVADFLERVQARRSAQAAEEKTLRLPAPHPASGPLTAAPTLDQIELASTRRTLESRAAGPGRSRGPVLLVAGAAVVAAIAVAVVWLVVVGQRRTPTEVPAVAERTPAETPPAATTPAEPPPPETAPIETTPAETELAAETGAETAPAVEPAPPPPPEPPPPTPRVGTLVVPAVSWTRSLFVAVEGKTYPLTRDWALELSPGSHLLSFEVAEGDYRARATVAVEIRAGETVRQPAPLAPPGSLRVRAMPGQPQARVVLDGEPVGTSPCERKVAPGEHQLRILPLDDGAPLERWITVRSDAETIVTFDPASGEVVENTKEPSR